MDMATYPIVHEATPRDVTALAVHVNAHPRNPGTKYEYGTAGFRMKAHLLPSVTLRMGLLAALRSLAAQPHGPRLAVGVMITASHNPVADNGVKIVDVDGGMLEMKWEPIATQLANMKEEEVADFVTTEADKYQSVLLSASNSADGNSSNGVYNRTTPIVIIGSDTRPSSEDLRRVTVQAARLIGAHVIDYGYVTTPVLHWAVGTLNNTILHSSTIVPTHTPNPYPVPCPVASTTTSTTATDTPTSNTSTTPTTVLPSLIPSPLPESAYIAQLANAYHLIKTHMLPSSSSSSSTTTDTTSLPGPTARFPLILDCAHGVGSSTAHILLTTIANPASFSSSSSSASTPSASLPVGFSTLYPLRCLLVNTGGEGTEVNLKCGADFVQKEKVLPNITRTSDTVSIQAIENQANNNANIPIARASIDGDADRLVWYFVTENNNTNEKKENNNNNDNSSNKFHLLDGDKMTALISSYIIMLLKEAGIPIDSNNNHSNNSNSSSSSSSSSSLSVGAVQTAYANGSSTNYLINTINMPVACTCTGVKYLHHEAKHFDIGVYFEANGHGTVLFSDKFQSLVKAKLEEEASSSSSSSSSRSRRLLALTQLSTLPIIINPFIGDALSDLLLIDIALTQLQWNINQWDQLYIDLPSKMDKVVVPSREKVKTTNAERTCIEPEGLQLAIDKLINNNKYSRSFVRPSGTEDIVRVYAEAETQKDADDLCKKVQELVIEYCKE